jgi:hypothetical protein
MMPMWLWLHGCRYLHIPPQHCSFEPACDALCTVVTMHQQCGEVQNEVANTAQV